MLQGEHFAILSTFIKLPFVIKIFVLSIFEWLFYIGFTVKLQWFKQVVEEQPWSSFLVKLRPHVVPSNVNMRVIQ